MPLNTMWMEKEIDVLKQEIEILKKEVKSISATNYAKHALERIAKQLEIISNKDQDDYVIKLFKRRKK